MPIHDWTRVEPGTFHHFHQAWTIALSNALNTGALPEGYYAMADQVAGGPIPDVITLRRPDKPPPWPPTPVGVAVAESPPHAHYITRRGGRYLRAPGQSHPR